MDEPKISIQKIIDDAIALDNAEPRTPSGKYNPSYLGLCHRKHFWKRKGEEQSNPPDARSFRVFQCGHLFEYYVTQHIPANQKQIVVETEDFKGYADVVTDDEVMDVKSINSKAFWYMDKETYDISVEKRQNILQVLFYASVLEKPSGRLVFVEKDTLSIREYGFFLEKWKVALSEEIEALKEIWRKQELPEASPQFTWECGKESRKFCPYYDKCKATGGKVWNEKK